MGKICDLTGERFGRLKVVKIGKDKYLPCGKRVVTWDCVCDCGNTTNVSSAHLKSGHTLSCGCAHKEQMEAWKTINLSHGRTQNKTPTKSYATWTGIKRRCYNRNDIDYPNYGKKGIKLWDGWKDNPKAFCEYAEALPRYEEEKTTIDRIDFRKDYEPGNIRWITIKEQQRNRSNNVWITANGETMLLQDWANRTGIDRRTIAARLKLGWSPEKAVNTPTRKIKE